MLAEGLTLLLGLAEMDADGLVLAEGLALGLTLNDADGLAEMDAEGLKLEEGEAEILALGDAEIEAETLAEGEAEIEDDGLTEAEIEADNEAPGAFCKNKKPIRHLSWRRSKYAVGGRRNTTS